MQAEMHVFKLRMSRALLHQVGEETRRSRRSKTQEIIVAIEAHLARIATEPRPTSGGQPVVREASQA
jgi:hypothetical protein